MSRCTCSPMCPRCGDGPCDCNCTKEEVAAHKAKTAANRLAGKAGGLDCKCAEHPRIRPAK